MLWPPLGFPGPTPRSAASGETLVAVGGHVYALAPWTSGSVVPARSWSREEAAGVGVLLAELHTELAAAMSRAPVTVPVAVIPPC